MKTLLQCTLPQLIAILAFNFAINFVDVTTAFWFSIYCLVTSVVIVVQGYHFY